MITFARLSLVSLLCTCTVATAFVARWHGNTEHKLGSKVTMSGIKLNVRMMHLCKHQGQNFVCMHAVCSHWSEFVMGCD